jgi:hypothetical protein
VIGALESFQTETAHWGVPALEVFIRRAMAAIEDEYRGNAQRAEEILAVGATGEDAARLIRDQRAMVHYRKQEHTQAVAIWREILPDWPVAKGSLDLIPLYACQRAANSAGRLEDWPAVTAFCQRGRELAKLLDEDHFEATFLADEAFARWKQDDRVGALAQLREALERLEQLKPDPAQPLQLHGARKMFEQVIKWCRSEIGIREEETYEPPAGVCSRIDFQEELKDYPPAPFDLVWLYLSEIESGVHQDRIIYQTAAARIPGSQFAVFRSVMSGLVIKESLRTLELADLVSKAIALVQHTESTKAQRAGGKAILEPDNYARSLPKDPSWVLTPATAAGLLALSAAGRPLDEFLPAWETEAKSLERFPDAAARVAEIAQVLAAPSTEITKLVRDGAQPEGVRLTAAVRLAVEASFGLEEMYYGQAMLLNYLSKAALQFEVAGTLGELLRKRWRERTGFPAAFPSPRINLPPIVAACDDSATGFRLAARILLAARNVVPFKHPDEVIANWRQLAG